jgi:4-diphosphocytidyl-2-C-methyl-D-erythritol kinase
VRITVAAPAKVNLWLRVGPLRPSGFHHLDTLFCGLALADTVTVRTGATGGGVQLRVDFDAPLTAPPDLGPSPDNLAVRAARAFATRAGVEPDFTLDLVKRIPPGGGLGGGSSDAAAVLRALARLHPGALSGDALLEMAGDLGSDVPFFASGHALAYGRGRGTELTPAAPLAARPVLIVLPPFGISTGAAYRWLDDDRRDGLLAAPPGLDTGHPPAPSWDDVAGRGENDFEPAVFRRHPELRALRDTLARHGARPALMAGSGSTLFGVYDDPGAARAAGDEIRRSAPAARTLMTRTRSA